MVPVLDLRLFTQAEINELAGASSDAGDSRGCDDVVIPKIDRSVFNESAGSRKQTYSRLRLAPRKPPELCGTGSSPSTSPPVSGRGRGRASRRGVGPSSGKPFSLSTADADGVGGRENGQIVQFLRQLFAENGTEIPSASAAAPEDRSDDLGTILGNEKLDHGTMGSLDKNSIVMNSNGPAVDMIRPEKEDFFEEVLGRMTQGLVTEEQCLAFLWRLDGKWASSRKRRKIVSAAHFGAGFPKDWQLLLGLKRRNGNVFVHCRRYVRNGGQMQKEGTLALHGYAPIVVSLEFSGHNERGSDENGNRNSDEPETGVKSGADEHYETIVQTQIDQDKLCISKDRYPESANRSINVSDMVAMVYETDSLDLHCWPTKNDIVMDDLLLDQDSLFGMSGCNREGNRLCTQSATSQMQVDGISVDRTITFKDDPRNDRLGEEIDGIFSQALIPET
ncbi:methyl-CPG-binding domain 8 isoform X2 [Wolffia australiana]